MMMLLKAQHTNTRARKHNYKSSSREEITPSPAARCTKKRPSYALLLLFLIYNVKASRQCVYKICPRERFLQNLHFHQNPKYSNPKLQGFLELGEFLGG
jgi:hypothetical protein